MFVFRISKKNFSKDLSGVGAGLYGGRWNPKGINMLYTSSSIALASLEFMIHNYHLLSTTNVCMAKIKITARAPKKIISLNQLPDGWNTNLGSQNATQQIGKQFSLLGKEYILKVPSSVISGEFNFLLNPTHVLHAQTEIVEIIDPFEFDKRLLDLGE